MFSSCHSLKITQGTGFISAHMQETFLVLWEEQLQTHHSSRQRRALLSCCTPCFSSNYLISVCCCWIKTLIANPACLEWQNWFAEPRVSHALQPDTLVPLPSSTHLSLALGMACHSTNHSCTCRCGVCGCGCKPSLIPALAGE